MIGQTVEHANNGGFLIFLFLQIQSDYEAVHEPGDLLSSTRTGLSLKAGPEHFINGHIQIRCQATITGGNHSVMSLPVQHNKATAPSSSKIGYQKDALISGTFLD